MKKQIITIKSVHELTAIKGSIVEELLDGAKIICQDFDGLNYHVLIERPRGAKWRFAAFKTLHDLKTSTLNYFYLMTEYNYGKAATRRRYLVDVSEDRCHVASMKKRGKYSPELLKSISNINK